MAWRVIRPPHISDAKPFSQLSKPEKIQRRVDGQKLTTQIDSVTREIRSGARKNFRIEASEDQLNTLLQDRLDTSKFPIRDLYVALSPDEVALQGRANYQGIDATATVSGNITAQKGQLAFEAGRFQIQGFSVGSLRRKVEKQVTKALNDWSAKMPGRIDSVVVADKKIIIEGTTQK